ncbi:hypothetical protein OJAV_G00200380 [Oryzias javanicus]|uniref:Uncharacterized protein n=1 Tax=Oryzias javanicus TaxID=123683 RepID=A0A437C8X0_ORYJA|nr:hypothetical protein OJAV_G00200380 [Oryzias javanicus]
MDPKTTQEFKSQNQHPLSVKAVDGHVITNSLSCAARTTRPGSRNAKADALSRRDDIPSERVSPDFILPASARLAVISTDIEEEVKSSTSPPAGLLRPLINSRSSVQFQHSSSAPLRRHCSSSTAPLTTAPPPGRRQYYSPQAQVS